MKKLIPDTLTESEMAIVEKHGGCSTCGVLLTFYVDSENIKNKIARCGRCFSTYRLGEGPFIIKVTKHFAMPDFGRTFKMPDFLFNNLMSEASAFLKTSTNIDLTNYLTGYTRGLSRYYHGEKFGTKEEHNLWLSLGSHGDGSDDTARGYMDGFAGCRPNVKQFENT